LKRWYKDNSLALNVSKTKELIVDFRNPIRTHSPLERTPVEIISCFHFLGLQISDDLV